MLLAIDIGNTTISSALINHSKIKQMWDILSTDSVVKISRQLKAQLKEVKKKSSGDVEVIICSVVPPMEKLVASIVRRELKNDILVLGKNIHVPIVNKYHHPKHVGQDRLVVAYAAKRLYGYPAIVIDLGTAITFDVVSQKGDYEGGMIVPGIKMSMDSLFKKTAMLPKIKDIAAPKSLIGKTTKESILSGIFNGYGMMCEGLIEMIGRNVKGKPKVIVTGGYAHLMRKFIRHQHAIIDPQLVFKGLELVSK